jgi:hypothetical protein
MSELFWAIFTNLPFYFVLLLLRQFRMEVARKSSDSCHKFVRPSSRKLSGSWGSCQTAITKVIRQLSGKCQAFVKQSSDCHQAVVFLGICCEVVRKFSRSDQTVVCHKVVRPSSWRLSVSCPEVFRQTSQSSQAFIMKLIRQLSGHSQTEIGSLLDQ